MDKRPLVIGMGNEFRGDDGIGPLVVWQMSQSHAEEFDFHTVGEDLTVLLDTWKGREVIIVDAILDESATTGTIRISQSMRDWLEANQKVFSSHSLTLDGVFQMGVELGKVPTSYLLLGVVGKNWNMGTAMSEEVKAAMPQVIARIMELKEQ